MKRFYTMVSTAGDDESGYRIELDGKPVKTQGGRVLSAPTAPMADAIVKEWASQDVDIDPETMPLTQILNTAQDRVAASRQEMQAQILNYLDTDLLCYRTDQPEAMAKRQAAAWDPWLEWFSGRYECALQTTTTLQALSQPQTAHDKVDAFVTALNDLDFTVLQLVTATSGSQVSPGPL